MKNFNSRQYSILTGDIIRSSRFHGEERGQLYTCLAKSAQKLLTSFPEDIPYPVQFYRGDSWQLFVAEPAASLHIALFSRTILKGYCPLKGADTRVAIGVGTIELLPPKDISNGDGEAFRLSGKVIKMLSKPPYMGLFLPSKYATGLGSALDMLVKLIDLKARCWTQNQAKCISGSLLGLSQETISRNFKPEPISQQAISQHLHSAGWRVISIAMEFYEKQLPLLLNESTL